jgi:dTDP-4-amino-4,6-dideoxygalactose transaminase
MSDVAALVRKIEFCDLKAQQRRIRPQIDAAITRVLDHGQYIMGPEVAALEADLAAFSGAKHAISCASGTDALLIAMMAKGFGPGDGVLCPDFTYTATPETIALLGATPVFVDVDPATFNIDPAGLEDGLAVAKASGLKPRAIIAVDLFGLPANYKAIRAFADKHGLFVLADAAQSFGATSEGRSVGQLGDVTATSFFPAKPLGCYGDGGAIFTDDDELANVMKSIRLHGQGKEKYEVVRIGVNGRLDTVQAAVLIEKLKIFSDEIDRRNAVAARYGAALAAHVNVPTVSAGSRSVWAQYTLQVDPARRGELGKALAARGIPTQVYYPRPLHRQSAYAHYPLGYDAKAGGNSERLSASVLSLPMHPYLLPEDQDYVIANVLALV